MYPADVLRDDREESIIVPSGLILSRQHSARSHVEAACMYANTAALDRLGLR